MDTMDGSREDGAAAELNPAPQTRVQTDNSNGVSSWYSGETRGTLVVYALHGVEASNSKWGAT